MGKLVRSSSAVTLATAAVCVLGSSAAGTEPIYVSIVMHNEEPVSGQYPDFVNEPPAFWQHRNALVPFVNMLSANGVMFNYQSDWNFLQAAEMYDDGTPTTNWKNIVRYMKEDLGFEVDPHAHETQYNYADVAYLIQALGVLPSNTVGGFLAFPPDDSKLEYLWSPITATLDPGYVWEPQVLWGGATLFHIDEESLWISGIWKPRDNGHFLMHGGAAPLPHVGGFGGAWSDLDRLIQMQQSGELEEGLIHTCTIFVGQNSVLVPGFIQQFEQHMQTHDAAGDVHWVGLAEVVDIWQTQYDSQPNTLRWRTFADYDEDGTVDLADLAEFSTCLSEPLSAYADPLCGVFDFEPDTDVDLADFAAFQKAFGE
jgi:hypothetical protein